jgi:hypothetical protein
MVARDMLDTHNAQGIAETCSTQAHHRACTPQATYEHRRLALACCVSFSPVTVLSFVQVTRCTACPTGLVTLGTGSKEAFDCSE